MPIFKYRARNQRGEAVDGRLEAASPDALASQLVNSGVTPIHINEATDSELFSLKFINFLRGEKVDLTSLIFLSRQMYTLLNAGVPIMQSLRGLRDTTNNVALAKVIDGVYDSLDSGFELSASLRRYPNVFSPLYVSLVQVGETTGRLPETFLQLANHLEREKDTRDQVKHALRYPMLILVAMAVGIAVINIFVIPAFADLYSGFQAQLPWATRLLIRISNFMVRYWGVILAIITLSAVGIHQYLKTPNGRYRWHRWQLKIPVVGRILFLATISRFAGALALTIRSGVDLVHGMTVVSRAVGNDFLSARIVQMRDGIERGESVARTAAATGLFPPMVLQMITVGEETGAIDTLMDNVRDYYDREVEHGIKNLSGAIEPIMIIFIAVLVFIMALGVFLPMWDLATAVKGS